MFGAFLGAESFVALALTTPSGPAPCTCTACRPVSLLRRAVYLLRVPLIQGGKVCAEESTMAGEI